MKLALLTTLTTTMAVAAAAATDEPKVMPQLFGALELGEQVTQPAYCYPPTPADWYCYKDGYPKCCTKNKGNCPNNVDNKPGCECDGGNEDCNPGMSNDRGARCILGNDDCPTDMYCAVDEGQCMLRIAEIKGRCKSMPESCPSVMEKKCGCDDKTYDNACDAAYSGVNVAFDGRCGGNRNSDGSNSNQSCTYLGVDNDNCGKNEFCLIGTGDCRRRSLSQEGGCIKRPAACGSDWNPVCGCDGVTYSNECSALSAGINVMRDSEC